MINLILYLSAVCLGVALSVVFYLFKNKRPSKEISLKSVETIIEEANFWSSIERVAKGEKDDDAECKDTGYAYALMPCKFYECACSETREDCCNSKVDIGDKRYCKVLINLNRLCGLSDIGERPDTNIILTEEEAKILGDKIVEFIQELKREKLS